MDLNLDDLNSLVENDDHFAVDHATAGKYSLHKAGLPDGVQAVLRSIVKGHAAAQQALTNAPGGPVRHAADGDVVPADTLPADGVLSLPARASSDTEDPSVIGAVERWIDQRTNAPPDQPWNPAGNPATQPPPAPPPQAGPVEGPDFAARAAALEQPAAPVQTSASASLTTHGAGGGPSLPAFHPKAFDTTQLDAATAQQVAGEEAFAHAQEGLAKQRTALQDESNARYQEISADYAARLAAHQKKIDSTVSWLANNDVDPNRLFHHQSTAGAIGSAISIFLSGIGAGITHAPNAALQVIDKAVNDDIDAQKENREGRKSLLQVYLAEGRGIEEAARLAKADELTHTAGLLASAAAKWGGPAALAESQKAIGALKAQAFELKKTAEVKDLERQHLPFAWEQQRQLTNLKMQEERLKMSALLGKGATVANPVRLPSGQVVPANSKEEATQATQELEAIQNARGVLAKGKALGPTLGVFTEGTGSEESLKAQLLANLERVLTKGVRNKDLLAQVKAGTLPNFGAWFATGKKDAKIEALEQMLQDRENAIVNGYTQAPFRRPVQFTTQ